MLLRSARRLQHESCTSLVRFASVKADQLAAVKALRERSGAPISEVKGALQETGWDTEQAFTALRKKGLAAASKKASRHAAEGLVGVSVRGKHATIVEVNSETDFAARDDRFTELVRQVAEAAELCSGARLQQATGASEIGVGELAGEEIASGARAGDALGEVAAVVRENIRIRRAFRLEAPDGGALGVYLHNSAGPGLGKAGALVALAPLQAGHHLVADQLQRAQDLGRKVAMHAVAMKPEYLRPDSVPEGALEAEQQVLREQAAKTGKPPAIVEKMLQGRMKKFYQEACLVEQPYVQDDSHSVKAFVKAASAELGVPLQVTAFIRLQCGEGLEKEGSKTFSEEVQALTQGKA